MASENNESETTYTSTSFPGFSPIRPFGSRGRDLERPWLELDGHVVPETKLILREESFVWFVLNVDAMIARAR